MGSVARRIAEAGSTAQGNTELDNAGLDGVELGTAELSTPLLGNPPLRRSSLRCPALPNGPLRCTRPQRLHRASQSTSLDKHEIYLRQDPHLQQFAR